MEQEAKDQRVTILMSERELAEVDDWCKSFRVKSRGEGIRHLISTALTMPEVAIQALDAIDNNAPEEEVENALTSLRAETHHYLMNTDIVVDVDKPKSQVSLLSEFTETSFDALVELIDNAIDARLTKGAKLTDKEAYVFNLAATDHTPKQISRILNMSEHIVLAYMKTIELKTGKPIYQNQEALPPAKRKKIFL